MNKSLARLRRLSVEHASTGTAESRDYAIGMFIQELTGVVCEEVVDATSDGVLYTLYSDWAGAVIRGEGPSDRRCRLVSAITVFPKTQLTRAAEQSNVVHLYG